MVDRRQQAVIADYFYKSGESVSWVLNSRKDLLDHGIQDLVTLFFFAGKSFSVDNEDRQMCSPDSKGQFSIKSLYDTLVG